MMLRWEAVSKCPGKELCLVEIHSEPVNVLTYASFKPRGSRFSQLSAETKGRAVPKFSILRLA